MQTFGDLIGHNPHCHILVTDGCFYGNKGMFRVASPLELKKLEAIFQHKVFRMFLAKGKITRELIAMLSSWRHSGWRIEGMDGAAAILGLNPSTLRARMHKLGIVRPETKEPD